MIKIQINKTIPSVPLKTKQSLILKKNFKFIRYLEKNIWSRADLNLYGARSNVNVFRLKGLMCKIVFPKLYFLFFKKNVIKDIKKKKLKQLSNNFLLLMRRSGLTRGFILLIKLSSTSKVDVVVRVFDKFYKV